MLSKASGAASSKGHLRRVSIGYDYTRDDYVTIPAGETASVGGRSFTAPKDRDLRVVKPLATCANSPWS